MVKNPPTNLGDARDGGSIPGLGKSPGIRNGNSLKYSCLKNSIRQRVGLLGHSPWGYKELDMTEQLSMHPSMHII